MLDSAFIFRSSQDIPGFFDALFGGVFLAKGIPLLTQLGILFFLPLAILGAVAAESTRKSIYVKISQACSWIVFTLISLLLLQPWDELFVNLRHSYNWAHHNTFSFNHATALEGLVDFLPYFLIGCLGKLGFSLIDLSFIFCYLGGILCLYAGVAFIKKWGISGAQTWGFLLLSLFAPLGFNASHGFATTVFTAAILWAIYLYFHSRFQKTGLILFSLIPLIRTEGAWLVILLFGFRFIQDIRQGQVNSYTKRWISLALVLLPLVGLSVYRTYTFGSPIPLPVQYKSSLGSLFYFLIGMRNLAADLVACYGLLALLVLAMLYFLSRQYQVPWKEKHPEIADFSRTWGPFYCLILYSLPYYLSGGDWFPSYWGRYLLPFTLYSVLLAGSLLRLGLPHLPSPTRFMLVSITLGTFLFQTLWPISSYWKFFDRTFTRRKTLAKLHYRHIGRGHFRIHYLAQLGTHLKRTTRSTDIIGSSEVATIMFFAERDTLDLLGIVNPEIVDKPLRKLPELFRKYPNRSELPYLIFKRINPDLVRKHKPEIIYTFDFILRDIYRELPIQQLPSSEITDELLLEALKRWHYALKGLVDPLYHGVDDLLHLGYQAVIVHYKDGFCGMYFVSPSALGPHLQKLKENGFKGGWKGPGKRHAFTPSPSVEKDSSPHSGYEQE